MRMEQRAHFGMKSQIFWVPLWWLTSNELKQKNQHRARAICVRNVNISCVFFYFFFLAWRCACCPPTAERYRTSSLTENCLFSFGPTCVYLRRFDKRAAIICSVHSALDELFVDWWQPTQTSPCARVTSTSARTHTHINHSESFEWNCLLYLIIGACVSHIGMLFSASFCHLRWLCRMFRYALGLCSFCVCMRYSSVK